MSIVCVVHLDSVPLYHLYALNSLCLSVLLSPLLGVHCDHILVVAYVFVFVWPQREERMHLHTADSAEERLSLYPSQADAYVGR